MAYTQLGLAMVPGMGGEIHLYPPPSYATPYSHDVFGSSPFAGMWAPSGLGGGMPGLATAGPFAMSPFGSSPFAFGGGGPFPGLGLGMGGPVPLGGMGASPYGTHPAWNGYGGVGTPYPGWDINHRPSKDDDEDTKLNPYKQMARLQHPFFGAYGTPFPIPADEEEFAQQMVVQLLNPASPWSGHNQAAHNEMSRILGNSDLKKAVVPLIQRALESGGKYAAYCLPWLQHLKPEDMGDMVEPLGHIADLGADDAWHDNDPYLIMHAHYLHAAAKAASDKKERDNWDKFIDVHGNPRCAWPKPPEPIGWTFQQAFPKWNGDPKKVPDGWTMTIIPNYQLAQIRMGF